MKQNMPKLHMYGLIALIAVCALSGILLLSRNDTRTITIRVLSDQPAQVKVSVDAVRGSEGGQTFRLQPDQTKQVRVGEGDYRITGTQDGPQDSAETIVLADARHAADNKTGRRIDLKLTAPKPARSVASQSQGCGFMWNDVYYSYACYSESTLQRHDDIRRTGFSTATPVAGVRVSDATGLVGDNVVTLINDPAGPYLVRYSLSGGIASRIPMPPAMAGTPFEDMALLLNETPGSKYPFAVVDRESSTWHLYRGIEDADPVAVDQSAAAKQLKGDLRLVSLQLNGDTMTSLYAPDLISHDDAGEAAVIEQAESREKARTPSHVIRYSADSRRQTASVPVAPELQAAEVRYLTNSTYILTGSNGKVSFMKERGKKLEPISRPRTNGGVAVRAGRALLWDGGNISVFDAAAGTMVRVFASKVHDISGAYYSGDTVGFTAFPKPSGNARPATSPEAFVIGSPASPGKASE